MPSSSVNGKRICRLLGRSRRRGRRPNAAARTSSVSPKDDFVDMAPPPLASSVSLHPDNLVRCRVTNDYSSDQFDSLVLIGDDVEKFRKLRESLYQALKTREGIDNKFHSTPSLLFNDGAGPARIIFSPVGSLTGDFDDVRRFYDAGSRGIERAIGSGSKRPFLVCEPSVFKYANFAAIAGALDVTYSPIERRMATADKMKVDYIGSLESSRDDAQFAECVNRGKIVTKDIGGGSPEVMAPPQVRDYVLNLFRDCPWITIKVIDDPNELDKEFPLFSAVDRASRQLKRHRGCIIELGYTGTGTISETVFLVGKGITYDTGGADVKINGGMRFMSFDKVGAATVAGFFKILSEVRPPGLKVVGLMAMARNNIGEEAYVSDEIIKSRNGTVICIGNTDAEGRMVMADVLCYAKEMALKEENPTLYTIATLTGHVRLAYGSSYAAIVQNKPALDKGVGDKLKLLSHDLADPLEISYLRKEDFDFISYPGDKADVLQCNTLPSSATPRGHIFPAAFLIKVSGLDKHGSDSIVKPLPYCHLDIASAAMPLPGTDTARAASLTTLAYMYLRKGKQ